MCCHCNLVVVISFWCTLRFGIERDDLSLSELSLSFSYRPFCLSCYVAVHKQQELIKSYLNEDTVENYQVVIR